MHFATPDDAEILHESEGVGLLDQGNSIAWVLSF